MDLAGFLQERRPGWKELELLLDQVEGSGLSSLAENQAVTLGILYRRAASDLNQAQTFLRGEATARYLNDLVARAYLAIYGRRSLHLGSLLASLFWSYPAIFRKHLRMIALAGFLFAAGAVFGFLVSWYDREAARAYLLPAEMAVIQPRGEGSSDPAVAMTSGELVAFSSFLFTNNLTVTLVAFALGITLGIGTVWLMFSNGLLMGVIAAIFAEAGQLKLLAAGVLPHGVVEIPAALLGGAGGLLLARALLQARPWPRREELARQGKEALVLVAGAVPLLAAAAVIEAGVARAPDSLIGGWLKLTVAAAVGILFLAYVTLLGREGKQDDAEGAPAETSSISHAWR